MLMVSREACQKLEQRFTGALRQIGGAAPDHGRKQRTLSSLKRVSRLLRAKRHNDRIGAWRVDQLVYHRFQWTLELFFGVEEALSISTRLVDCQRVAARTVPLHFIFVTFTPDRATEIIT
jgi:hypothetical protein